MADEENTLRLRFEPDFSEVDAGLDAREQRASKLRPNVTPAQAAERNPSESVAQSEAFARIRAQTDRRLAVSNVTIPPATTAGNPVMSQAEVASYLATNSPAAQRAQRGAERVQRSQRREQLRQYRDSYDETTSDLAYQERTARDTGARRQFLAEQRQQVEARQTARARQTQAAVARFTPRTGVEEQASAAIDAVLAGDAERQRQRTGAVNEKADEYRQLFRRTTRNLEEADDYRTVYYKTVNRLESDAAKEQAGEYRRLFRRTTRNLRQADQYRQLFYKTTQRLREEAEEKAAAGGADEDPDRNRGRLFGLRMGRLGMIATAGFAVYSAARLGRAFGQYNQETALAGRDQEAQFEAENKFQERVTTSVPILGELAGWLADSTGFQTRSQVIAQDAREQDARTQLLARAAETRRALAERSEQFRLGTGSYAAQRTAGGDELAKQYRTSFDERTKQGEADSKAVETLRRDREATRKQRIEQRLLSSGASPTMDEQNRRQAVAEQQIDAEDTAAVANMRRDLAKKRDDRMKQSNDAADKVHDAQLEQINAQEKGYAEQTRAMGLGRQGFSLASRFASIDAQFVPVFDKNGKIIAFGDVKQSQNPQDFNRLQDRYNELREGAVQDVGRQEAELRERTQTSKDVMAASVERRGLVGRLGEIKAQFAVSTYRMDPASPEYKLLDEDRKAQEEAAKQEDAEQQQRRRLTTEGRIAAMAFALNRMPLKGRIASLDAQEKAALVGVKTQDERDRIRQDFDDQRALAVQDDADSDRMVRLGLRTRGQQLAAMFRRDPTGSAAAGIAGEAEAEALRFGQAGKEEFAKRALELGGQRLELLKRDYLESFRAVEVDLRRQTLSNPRDAEDPNKVMQTIEEAAKQMRDAVTQGMKDGFANLIVN